jgi:dipeptidyl aminopeptidase/acylaminoacyl peptidase
MAELIPRRVLFGNPERISPRISPDASTLAWIAPHEGVLNVWTAPVGPDGADWAAARVVTDDTDRGIRMFTWAHDGRHLLYLQDTGGDENWRLHDVDLQTMQRRDLTPFEGVRAELIAAEKKFPTDILVGLNRDNPQLHDVYQPVAFSADGGSLLALSSVGANTARLVRINLASGATQVLAEDPEADVTGLRVHPDTREPQIVIFEKQRSQYLALDPAYEPDIAAIRALHPGDPSLGHGDDDDRLWLIGFTNDTGPVPFYAYDRQTRQGQFVFEHQPELSRYELAPMEPVEFTARDGLTIHGYATFPPGAGRSGLPMVLNVHGGPWARDAWGFDPEAQWFANRGYLCVQVNFRGSTGYGKAFVNAGDREWGGKMQDDLLDAVAFAVGQGWADPARVAIYGGSYGGYAALAGAAFTPDEFRCAVDIVGPSNLKTLIETIPPYWAPMIALFHTRVGDPEKDADFLWSRSPLSRAADIRTPLLIAQGANDPRVKQAESEQIVAALREHGIDYEYMLFPDEGHGFAKPENRLRFYAEAERFLARHLGGRAEE